MKAVITADIVNSTKIEETNRYLLVDELDNIIQDLKKLFSLRCEMYRGDSFQVLVDDVKYCLEIAVLIRLGLKKSNLLKNGKLDARMAIGVGEVSYEHEQVILSDGEAFRLSGRTFDKLNKRRLLIATNINDVDEPLNVMLAFIDELLKGLSYTQSKYLYDSLLYNMSQMELANVYNTSQPNIAKHLKSAKENLFRLFFDFAEKTLKSLDKKW
jgi:hypothetical protein